MFTITPSTHRAARFLAVACSLAALSLTAPAWALGSTPVTVVNPTTSPVPSTIVNPTTSPVPNADVDNPARQPFQVTIFPNSSTSNQAIDSFKVPAGKRLVIEYMDGEPQNTAVGAKFLVVLETTAGGQAVVHVAAAGTVTDFGIFNQLVRIYADPGTDVIVTSSSSGSGNNTGAFLTISGYLVNVP